MAEFLSPNINIKNFNERIRFWIPGQFSFVENSLFKKDCAQRIDITTEKTKDVFYRFLVLSCDQKPVIQSVFPIRKNPQVKVIKLFVSMFDIDTKSIGNIEMGLSIDKLRVKGNLYNLKNYANKKLGLHIHTTGDITNQCKNCGSHYNPTSQFHGGLEGERHLGDLGNISVDSNGEANVDIIVDIPLEGFEMAGRSLVLHDKIDDLGLGKNNDSFVTGNSGGRIACGVIGAEYLEITNVS